MSDEHVTKTWVVENTWVCTSCKHVNRGRDMACTECKSPREKREEDVVPSPDAAPAVTDPELLAMATAGPNWVCSFCGSQDRTADGKCKNCGAGRDIADKERKKEKNAAQFFAELEGDANVAAAHPRHVKGQAFREFAARVGSPPTSMLAAASLTYPPPRSDLRAWVLAVIASTVLFGMITLGLWLFVPHKVHARVNRAHWLYTATLRQRVTVHKTGWGHSRGAFNVSCQRRFKDTERCNPYDCDFRTVSERYVCGHHDCRCHDSCRSNRNGFSTCSTVCSSCPDYCTRDKAVHSTCWHRCDVYDDWCEYDEYDWPVADTATSSGEGRDTNWPALEARGELQKLERREEYWVEFSAGGKVYVKEPPTLDAYRQYAVGQVWQAEVTRVGTFTLVGKE